MQMYFKATPAGEYVIKDWSIANALQYWGNQEALEMLQQIVNEQVPAVFNPELLIGLINHGLVEFEVTSSSNSLTDEDFRNLLNPNF